MFGFNNSIKGIIKNQLLNNSIQNRKIDFV